MTSHVPVEGHAASGSKPAPPATLVIFGAGGDLTKRLLMPALYNLAGSHLLDDRTTIWGVDHTDGSDESWRQNLSDTMESFTKDDTAEFHAKHIDPAAWGFVRDGCITSRATSWRPRPTGRSREDPRQRGVLPRGGGPVLRADRRASRTGRAVEAGRRRLPPRRDREAVRQRPRLGG